MTFTLLKVKFWMAINIRFWNPHSEDTWWVKHVLFHHIIVSDRFEGLHFVRTLKVYDWSSTCFLTILSYPTFSKVYTSSRDSYAQPVFFVVNFSLLKVSFWMTINLRFWKSYSKSIWLVKPMLFSHIVVSDRFEGLHFLCRLFRPTSNLFALSTF